MSVKLSPHKMQQIEVNPSFCKVEDAHKTTVGLIGVSDFIIDKLGQYQNIYILSPAKALKIITIII